MNSEVLLRICTPAAQRSERVAQEVAAFRLLQAQKGAHRRLISIILDAGYVPEPLDAATLFIDATKKQRFQWMGELARPLDVSTASRRLSRRSAIGLGVAGAVALASATSAGVVLYKNRPAQNTTDYSRLAGNKRWAKTVDSGDFALTPQLVADAAAVYAIATQGLVALDPLTGKSLWASPATVKSTLASGRPAMSAGHIILGGDNHGGACDLYAVEARAGTVAWRTPLGADGISTPVVADGAVYALVSDGSSNASTVMAFTTGSGATLWQSDVSVQGGGFAPPSTVAGGAGLVFAGAFDHHLVALGASDGKPRWRFLARGPITGAPAIDGGMLFFGSGDGNVYALDAATGAARWRFRTAAPVRSTPAVRDGVLYVGADDGYLYALDTQTGAPFWRAAIGDPSAFTKGTSAQSVTCLPALGPDVVYVTSGGDLFAFNLKDGTRRWRYQASSDYSAALDTGISSPVLVAGVVLCGVADHTVQAVNT